MIPDTQFRILLVLFLITATVSPARADHLYLKNGLHLEGTAAGVYGINQAFAERDIVFEKELAEAGISSKKNPPFRVIDDGVRRYIVSTRQVRQLIQEDELARAVSFKLTHQKEARTSGIQRVGAFVSVEPFQNYGRRTVMLRSGGQIIPVIQGITDLRPDYSRVESLKYNWEYSIDTNTIPPDVIESLIEQSSNRKDPDERKAAVLFYIQATMYPQAKRELIKMQQEFSELNDWCSDYLQQIEESQALQFINEIERRQASGQHTLAYSIAKKFPVDRASAQVVRKAEELGQQYEKALEDRDQILMMLDVLQAEVPMELAIQLKPLQAKLTDELHFETINRLEPFLRSDLDDSLSAEQKLALAYSGWLLGSAEAILDLKETIRLWEARYLVLDFLRTDRDPTRDEEILNQLKALEGLSVARLEKMIPLLPMAYEPNDVQPMDLIEIQVPSETDAATVKYTLQLPPEYSPHHRYPLIVALRGEGRSYENTVRWWGGDSNTPGWSQRRGYIVIAPHYCSPQATDHDYSSESHRIVLESIKHLRKRYRIDSDRIFISGNGMGGDACFDIALSNPGIFAGAIPITGVIDKYAQFYWENAPDLPWYIVAGQRDRDSKNENAVTLNRMMKAGDDVLYCEYKDRGFESYHEEQEEIFTWMQNQRRPRIETTREFTVGGLRVTDNQFHWLHAEGLPSHLYQPISWQKSVRKNPRLFEGKINVGGSIIVKHPGTTTILNISPELFDFEQRCKLTVNGRQVFNDYLQPSLTAMLEDFRERGDRERLYWARLESTYRETVAK